MSKRMLIALVAVTCLALLIWVFTDSIAQMAQFLWGLDDDTRGKINDWLGIVSGAAGILAGLVGALVWLWNVGKKKPDTPAPSFLLQAVAVDHNGLLAAYYQKLHRSCEKIDLSLVDVKFTEYARSVENSITLPVVYQEMDVLPCRSEKDDGDNAEGKMHTKGQERKPLMQASAEDKYRRVVILGDPGSGKSMFMDNLAWQVAGSHTGKPDERLPAEFRRLPLVRVRVRLRSAALLCKGKGFDAVALLDAMRGEVVALVGEENGTHTWQALEASLLDHGIILLDGLDEVPETEGMRVDVLDAIDALLKRLGQQARLIITSRPYVFEDKHRYWLDAFSCLELQPMANWQVEQFINNWYRLLRETRGRSEALALQNAHELFVDLQDRDHLMEPARRPLILTLLTSLHFSRDVLPHSRAELYQEAVALMLERWTQRIYRENPEYPLDDFERKALAESSVTRKIALQKLALDATRKRRCKSRMCRSRGCFPTFFQPIATLTTCWILSATVAVSSSRGRGKASSFTTVLFRIIWQHWILPRWMTGRMKSTGCCVRKARIGGGKCSCCWSVPRWRATASRMRWRCCCAMCPKPLMITLTTRKKNGNSCSLPPVRRLSRKSRCKVIIATSTPSSGSP